MTRGSSLLREASLGWPEGRRGSSGPSSRSPASGPGCGPHLGPYSGLPPTLVHPFCYLSPPLHVSARDPQSGGVEEIAGRLLSSVPRVMWRVQGRSQSPWPRGLRDSGRPEVFWAWLGAVCSSCSLASNGYGSFTGQGRLGLHQPSRGCQILPSSPSSSLPQTCGLDLGSAPHPHPPPP